MLSHKLLPTISIYGESQNFILLYHRLSPYLILKHTGLFYNVIFGKCLKFPELLVYCRDRSIWSEGVLLKADMILD